MVLGASALQAAPAIAAEQALPAQIRLVSDVWEGHTESDGRGLAWDILRRVFEPAGVALQIQSVPYTRSIGLVQRGEADAWVGSYRDEVSEHVVYPRWHYGDDQISVLGLASQPVPTLETLGGGRLVWMRGYKYQHYLPNLLRFREIQRRSGILPMLVRGHVDFYVDARTEVEQVLREAADPTLFRITDVQRLPLFLGFADNPQGRALAALFDRRMEVLVKNASLRPLFAHWQQPYPFD
ncbi:MAG: substrate-binding periplasmic protein [Pseudomonas sp.]